MAMADISRCILRLSGKDTRSFLQGLITNDIRKLDQDGTGILYAAMLTPQGKYLADFFVLADHDDILIDIDTNIQAAFVQRLNMYKLRAEVEIRQAPLHVHRGIENMPDDAHPDPRHKALGWRAYRKNPPPEQETDWDALRVKHLIPATGIELTPETYILEAGFERLNGVDFQKGCYVGQEVTARMKHKTDLRKGLTLVHIEGGAETGSEITADGKSCGTLFTRSGNLAIAQLRFDRARNRPLQAGEASIIWHNTEGQSV